MPKTVGANTVEHIRDLELPNEHRKVLARVFSKLIGEKATQTMPKIQQAFLPGRDISEANVAVQEAYYRAAERGLLKFWLLLDCSKGYNNMSWEWIEKVLQAANLPEGLVRAALRLVRESSEVVFVFDRLDVQPSCFGKSSRAGLPTELRSVHPCS